MLTNLKEIVKIIEDELECEFHKFRTHNPSYTIVEMHGVDVLVKNDISPQEFRAKVAEAFLDRIGHFLNVAQRELSRAENEVKRLNNVYSFYYNTVQKISDGQIDSLEPINWKSYIDYEHTNRNSI